MAFLDKLFRWKKKPFSAKGGSAYGGKEAAKVTEDRAVAERGTGQYAHVLVRPHTSEQAVALGALNQYVFEIAVGATKHEVASAIRDLYGVIPEAVNIMNVGGKQIRFGRTQGRTKGWRKAIVTLPEGKTIDVYKK